MRLVVPIVVYFDDVESMVEEIRHLQTYKLSECDEMKLVNVEDVVKVMAKHIATERK